MYLQNILLIFHTTRCYIKRPKYGHVIFVVKKFDNHNHFNTIIVNILKEEICLNIPRFLNTGVCRDSLVCVAASYRLHLEGSNPGGGDIFRTALEPTQLLVKWVRGLLSWAKAAWA
jgi:hypothetical protein